MVEEVYTDPGIQGTFKDMRVLVTGGAGAIGSALVRALLRLDASVIVIDDLSSGHKRLLPEHENLVFLHADITDDVALEKIFSEPIDIIYHFAAHFANQNSVDHPIRDCEVNAIGTIQLLERAKSADVKRFIFASSSCVYGNISGSVDESGAMHPDTPYAISKLAAEQYVLFYQRMHDVPSVVLRIFNSYGPGELPGKYRNVIPNFIRKALDGEPLTITGTGKETRDFNHVDNLVHACLLCASTEEAVGEVFNIGGQTSTTIEELATIINEVTENKGGIEYVPRRSWDAVLHRQADITKARRVLGYDPQNDLHEGIKQTVAWIRKQDVS